MSGPKCSGDLDRARTYNLSLRRAALYPIELRGQDAMVIPRPRSKCNLTPPCRDEHRLRRLCPQSYTHDVPLSTLPVVSGHCTFAGQLDLVQLESVLAGCNQQSGRVEDGARLTLSRV